MRQRIFAILLAATTLVPAAAFAQTASEEVGQLRLYVQQLEEQVRRLTGQVEQLTYENGQLRAQAGVAPGPVASAPAAAPSTPGAPQDLGAVSVARNDPLVAPDGIGPGVPGGNLPSAVPVAPGSYPVQPTFGAPQPGLPQAGTPQPGGPQTGGPIDLSQLAGGAGADILSPNPSVGGTTPAAAPLGPRPAEPAPLGDDPQSAYNIAYGYVLTGDYRLAEESFRAWLGAFEGQRQTVDARFWLGESQFQQKDYSAAAKSFLELYNNAADSPKGPDALVRLGMSLRELGEKAAACSTFGEVAKKYPGAAETLKNRVKEESARAGC
jgi:tol-pal system protein YbgF